MSNELTFERLRVLGNGSFGEAFLVQRHEAGQPRKYVLKQIGTLQMSAEELRKAEREVEVLRKFSHFNIISYIESFVLGGRLCIVTEYADGGDLGDAVKTRLEAGDGFSDDEVLSIFVQLCLALRHVHHHRIIHRDVKAKNVFLTGAAVGPNITVKLGDFGVARVMSGSGSLADTQIGTPLYISPEIYEDKPYGKKSDIWSLGVLLHEIIALEMPFRATNLAALVRKILSEPANRLPIPRKGACGKTRNMVDVSTSRQGKGHILSYPSTWQHLVDALLCKMPASRPSAEDIMRNEPAIRGSILTLLMTSVPPPFVRDNLDDLYDIVGCSAVSALDVDEFTCDQNSALQLYKIPNDGNFDLSKRTVSFSPIDKMKKKQRGNNGFKSVRQQNYRKGDVVINYDQETSENRPDNIYFEAEDDTRCAANQDTQDFSYRESFTNGKTFVGLRNLQAHIFEGLSSRNVPSSKARIEKKMRAERREKLRRARVHNRVKQRHSVQSSSVDCVSTKESFSEASSHTNSIMHPEECDAIKLPIQAFQPTHSSSTCSEGMKEVPSRSKSHLPKKTWRLTQYFGRGRGKEDSSLSHPSQTNTTHQSSEYQVFNPHFVPTN